MIRGSVGLAKALKTTAVLLSFIFVSSDARAKESPVRLPTCSGPGLVLAQVSALSSNRRVIVLSSPWRHGNRNRFAKTYLLRADVNTSLASRGNWICIRSLDNASEGPPMVTGIYRVDETLMLRSRMSRRQVEQLEAYLESR